MTMTLPSLAAPSTPDRHRFPLVRVLDAALAENALLRDQLATVIDAIVAEQMAVHHNHTERQLAEIETGYRNHWAQVALNATKDTP